MKEKVVNLVEKRIIEFESVILECLQDERNKTNVMVADANVSIIQMCLTKKLELDDLLNEIRKIDE